MEIPIENISLDVKNEMSLPKLLGMIFIPSTILTIAYIMIGSLNQTIPSILLFYFCAMLILFPIELGLVLNASKKAYGHYSLQSVFAHYEKMSRWKIFLYGSLLFAFAGIMSVTLVPIENTLFAPISNKFTQSIPEYFNWTNFAYYKHYSKGIVLLTSVSYLILNVLVGPIVEELFFRGYLTSKLSRYGNMAPLIVTVLFSLYHLWLPFANLFRIMIFLPAAWVAWRKKNIFISIVFHCLCNLLSTIFFIISVYSG